MIFAKIVIGYGNAQNRSHKFFFFRSALEYGEGRAPHFFGYIPIGEHFRSESEAIHLRKGFRLPYGKPLVGMKKPVGCSLTSGCLWHVIRLFCVGRI